MNVTRELTPYEVQYIEILKDVINSGYRQMNMRTSIETIRIPHAVITVDLQEEFPILKCKHVNWKTALKEILWIMRQQSNNIHSLDAHIWDDWADENGSIGKSYGYQVAKEVVCDGITYPSQVHYVLNRLSMDSSDRRAVIDLWNVDDLNEMNLVPCCYSSIWTVIDNKLNCLLVQRSADYLVGVPFNTTQYAFLTHMFARHLGVEVGRLTHVMADCHIYCYDSHLNGAEKMISNYQKYDNLNMISRSYLQGLEKTGTPEFRHLVDVMDSYPKLSFDTQETDFFAIGIDDIQIDDYVSMGKISFDVAK